MGKWIALSLISLGIMCLLFAWRGDATASFEGGTFLLEIGLLLLGALLVAAGLIWLCVLAFVHL